MKIKLCTLLILCGILFSGCRLFKNSESKTDVFSTSVPRDFVMLMDVDGRQRMTYIHLPKAYKETQTFPLVVALHGGMGNGEQFRQSGGFSAVADSFSFIAVFPNGTGRLKEKLLTWNADFCCGFAQEIQSNDLEFLSALIDTMSAKFPVDKKRMYMLGHSNGGMMAYRFALQFPQKITAISISGSSLKDLPNKKLAHPISVQIIHGENDQHVPFQGGIGPKSLVKVDYQPVESVAMAWVKLLGADPVGETTIKEGVTKTVFKNDNGYELQLVSLKDTDHFWNDHLKRDVKAKPLEFLMWDFFKRHTK